MLWIVLIPVPLLALAAIYSRKTWIPIVICLILIRDFSLCPLIGDGTLKIGDVFIFYMFLLWLMGDIFIKNSNKFVKSKLEIFIILFILLNACSLLWSTNFELGLVRVLKLTRNFMFYIIIRELFIRDFWDSYKKTTYSYTGTSFVLLIVYLSVSLSAGAYSDFLALFQKATITSSDLGALRVRGTGGGFLISGPAMWFIITGIFAFGSLTLSNSQFVRTTKTLLILLMFVSATVLTLHRSVLVVVTIMLILLFWGSLYLRSKRYVVAISTMLIVFVVMGAALGLGKIIQKRFRNPFQDASWHERTLYYGAAIDAFSESPLMGIGVGSNYSWQENYPEIGGKSRTVHNAYLLVLSELGVSGFILFGVIIYFWIKYLWDCIRNTNADSYRRNISMTLLVFSISYLIYITLVGEFEAFEPWLVMAIASAIKNLKVEASPLIQIQSSYRTGSINLA